MTLSDEALAQLAKLPRELPDDVVAVEFRNRCPCEASYRRVREIIGDKLAGIAVHSGARVAALAQPGEVLVSSTVKDLVAGSGLHFEDRGAHALKGVPGEWHLYTPDRSAKT